MLRLRLKTAADMVRKGVVAADIGTDHAHLPVYLVRQGICPSVIASDVREGPLKNARENIALSGLSDKISTRLSDGLDSFSSDEADDFIFAGMGGTLITELLERTEWLKDPSKHLIIQPMTHAEDVREFLCKNGFEILNETACRDSGRLYTAMCAAYTGVKLDVPESYYYVGKLTECDSDEAREYLAAQRNRLKKAADALEQSGNDYIKLKEIVTDLFNEKA